MKALCLAHQAPKLLCICAVAIGLQACERGADMHADNPNGAPDIEAPSTPSELTVQAASSSSIDLNWKAATDNVGVVAYRVYRSDAASFVASVTSTTYADTGLLADTQYSYTVRAVDAAGNESPASNSATMSTLSAAPAAGTTLTPHVAAVVLMANRFFNAVLGRREATHSLRFSS